MKIIFPAFHRSKRRTKSRSYGIISSICYRFYMYACQKRRQLCRRRFYSNIFQYRFREIVSGYAVNRIIASTWHSMANASDTAVYDVIYAIYQKCARRRYRILVGCHANRYRQFAGRRVFHDAVLQEFMYKRFAVVCRIYPRRPENRVIVWFHYGSDSQFADKLMLSVLVLRKRRVPRTKTRRHRRLRVLGIHVVGRYMHQFRSMTRACLRYVFWKKRIKLVSNVFSFICGLFGLRVRIRYAVYAPVIVYRLVHPFVKHTPGQ